MTNPKKRRRGRKKKSKGRSTGAMEKWNKKTWHTIIFSGDTLKWSKLPEISRMRLSRWVKLTKELTLPNTGGWIMLRARNLKPLRNWKVRKCRLTGFRRPSTTTPIFKEWFQLRKSLGPQEI